MEVVYEAAPPLRVTGDPAGLPSMENCAIPVAAEGETVAVKLTACPAVDGFRLEARPVAVAGFPAGVLITASAELGLSPATLIAETT